MEVSVLSHAHPRSLPFASSSSSSSAKPNNCVLASATQTPTSSVGERRNSGRTAIRTRHSDSYSARQTAISQVQRSSDLLSALSRLEGVLQVQDLNAILRHFGSRKKWRKLSQIFEWMKRSGKINPASYGSYIKFMGESLNPIGALEVYDGI